MASLLRRRARLCVLAMWRRGPCLAGRRDCWATETTHWAGRLLALVLGYTAVSAGSCRATNLVACCGLTIRSSRRRFVTRATWQIQLAMCSLHCAARLNSGVRPQTKTSAEGSARAACERSRPGCGHNSGVMTSAWWKTLARRGIEASSSDGLQSPTEAWACGLTIRSSRDRFAVSRVIHSPAAVRLNSGVRPQKSDLQVEELFELFFRRH